jgi:phage terminase Nu1 subunit (DNA packaging protein)
MGGMNIKAKHRAGFLNHRTVADLFDVDTETLRKWVRNGIFPEPHDTLGQTWLYRAEWIDFYVENRRWPEGVKFRAGAGKGRGEAAGKNP